MANGVTARVVHVVDTQKGQMIEETLDYYRQNRAGHLWYLGEDMRFFRNGKEYFKPDSWQSGVVEPSRGGHCPPGHGSASDSGRSTPRAWHRTASTCSGMQQVAVSGRRFMRVLLFEETTPLEPEVADLFFFARGFLDGLGDELEEGPVRLA